jgi:putative ABC transport system permease protein
VEVAVAMVLLAAAGVMIRSVAKLVSIDPGFEASHVLTLRLNLPSGAMPQDAVPVFASQVLDRLRALPGVSAAGISDCQPLGERCSGTLATFPDRPADSVRRPAIGVRWVTADWFSALRIPLKRGRVFNAGDRRGAPSVVIVNETAAAQFWPKEDAVGKHMGMGQGGPGDIAEVVGVVGDVRGSIEAPPVAETYLAFNQAPRSNMIIFLRTPGDPGALAGPARLAIREVAPRYPQFDVQTMSARIARATARSRQSAVSLAALAAMALALTLVGVYGVVSFMVTQRTREIGIRLALGATRHDIFQLVMRESLGLTAIGVASGLLGAFWLSSLLKSLVFDVRPSDPIAFGATAMLLGLAAALASWIPARRAVRIDPAGTLRAE